MWVRLKSGFSEGFVVAIYAAPGRSPDKPFGTVVAYHAEGITGLHLADLSDLDVVDDLFDLPMRLIFDNGGNPIMIWREVESLREFGAILSYDDQALVAGFVEKKRTAYRVRDDAGPLSFRYGLLRDVLMTAWDPKGVAGIPEAVDEYDGYLEEIYMLVVSRQPASRIGDVLYGFETDGMRLPGDRVRAESIARRLLALRADPRW